MEPERVLTSKRSVAFSLIELLVVLGIVAILVALSFPAFQAARRSADSVVCTNKLRNLWLNFSNYLNDGEAWPQLPEGVKIGSRQEQEWWVETSEKSLGLSKKDWQCPTLSRYIRSATNASSAPLISYLPTLFDSRPYTPKLWPRMPWFTETASAHGSGLKAVMTDGSVVTLGDPVN